MEIQFIFRTPKFPMIANIGGHFVAAKTPGDLLNKLLSIKLGPAKSYNMVDSAGEGWGLYPYPTLMAISPLTMKKRWTKVEIINLFNERTNTEIASGKKYSLKSLSAKRFERIFTELVAMAFSAAE